MWVKRKISKRAYKRQTERWNYGSSPNFPKIQMKAVAIYMYVFLILLILCKCTGTHIHMFNNGTSYYAMEFV